LIASHIVISLLGSSDVGADVSVLASGWAVGSACVTTSGCTVGSGSEFSVTHVLVSSVHTVFSTIHVSPSTSHVLSNIFIFQVSLITSPVHSNTYITSHVSVSASSDLNRSFT
jgi:hypothetical protein